MINIVLYEPEIPQNTGNIMRTCVATNSKLHLIRPLGFSLDNNAIKRSGVNYIDKLEYQIYDDFGHFKENNVGKYYFFTRYGNKAHSEYDYDINDNIYIIFGKESTGIPRELLKEYIDSCSRIPMSENVRALNLSNSVAIVTYEILRQNNYKNLLKSEPHKGDFL